LIKGFGKPRGNQGIHNGGESKNDWHNKDWLAASGECQDHAKGPEGTDATRQKRQKCSTDGPKAFFSAAEHQDGYENGYEEIGDSDADERAKAAVLHRMLAFVKQWAVHPPAEKSHGNEWENSKNVFHGVRTLQH
jgi:hypothetical protein